MEENKKQAADVVETKDDSAKEGKPLENAAKPAENKDAPKDGDKKPFNSRFNKKFSGGKAGGSGAPNAKPQKVIRQSTTGYEEKIVGVKRISKTTKGGRSMRFSALAVIGDKKGLVGFGLGKSIEVPVAIKKALRDAKNNMFKIKMHKNGTVYHEVIGKHGAGKVLIKPASEGTGIIAGGPIKIVLEMAGFKDVYSKNLGRNTSLNMVRATIKGLLSQKSPKEFANLRDKDIHNL